MWAYRIQILTFQFEMVEFQPRKQAWPFIHQTRHKVEVSKALPTNQTQHTQHTQGPSHARATPAAQRFDLILTADVDAFLTQLEAYIKWENVESS